MSAYCECDPDGYPFICSKTGEVRGKIGHMHCKRVGQARGAVEAVTHWIRGGMRIAVDEVVDVRRETCLACPEWTGMTCRICGCTGVKWHLETSTCPKGYW